MSEEIESAREEIHETVHEAAETLRELMEDAEKERIRLKAAEAILDRAGLTKAKAKGASVAQRQLEPQDDTEDLLANL